jgi:hypothetical protein
LAVGCWHARCPQRPPSAPSAAPDRKVAKHRVESGIEKKMEEVLPAGAATLIAIYGHPGAGQVGKAIANAATTSVAEIDGKSVRNSRPA